MNSLLEADADPFLQKLEDCIGTARKNYQYAFDNFKGVVSIADYIKFKSRFFGRLGRIAAEGDNSDGAKSIQVEERMAKVEVRHRSDLLGACRVGQIFFCRAKVVQGPG